MNDWSPSRIKFELSEAGVTMTELSVTAGVSYQTISNAMRRPSPSGERAISDALGVEPSLIWPSRYLETTMTDDRLTVLDDGETVTERRQSWSRQRIEREMADRGFTNLRGVEDRMSFPRGSISQASSRCNEDVDRLIARVVGVTVETIFPSRYWVGGQRIPSWINIEQRSDEEFDHLKATMGDVMVRQVMGDTDRDDEGRYVLPVVPTDPVTLPFDVIIDD